MNRSIVAYLVLAARFLIGALFIYASLHKILDPAEFAQAIRNYQLGPAELTNLAAMILPWLELIAGALLILGIQTRPSALITTCLLAVFLVGLYRAYFIGLDIACGCFSSAASSAGRIDALTLARDTTLFVISLFIVIRDRGEFSLLGWRRSGA
ncbi:MAG: DoxX family membrane protein [Desulfomonile sp.]|nr:DoxX family membrane protein [Desulfomonile sp.]